MKARRAIIIASLVVTAAFLALFVLIFTVWAQPPPAPGGPPGAPGAPGAAGGGTALSWSETPGDPLLVMSYPEFLARHNVGPSPLPEGLLKDDKGDPAKRTDAQWAQLDELYAVNPAANKPVPPGHIGGPIVAEQQLEMAVTIKETTQILKAGNIPADGFTFKIGYPQYEPPAPGATSLTMHVGVLMQVKPWLQKSFGANLYRTMKPYDNYQPNRMPFTFVTYEGGPWHPETFYLNPGTIMMWDLACSQPGVVLVLKDSLGQIIDAGVATAGFNGNLPTLLASPPEVRRMPAFAYLMPDADRTFDGNGKMNLDYSRGWYYDFTFNLKMEDVRRLDRASAFMISPPMGQLVAALTTATTVDEMQNSLKKAIGTFVQDLADKMFGKDSKESKQIQQAFGAAGGGGAGAPTRPELQGRGMAPGAPGGAGPGGPTGLPGGLPMPPGATVPVP